MQARITNIASYFPENTLSNDDLCQVAPSWTADKILQKTPCTSNYYMYTFSIIHVWYLVSEEAISGVRKVVTRF